MAEMLSVLNAGESLPLHNMRDVEPLLASIAVEGTFLSAEELSTLRKALEAMSDVVKFFAAHSNGVENSYPALAEVASEIMTFQS